MQGLKRKIVYVSLFELIAIGITTTALAQLSGQGMAHSGALAGMSTAIALLWNLLFNSLFEWWEARQRLRGRTLLRRVAHALCFESGLVMMLVPLFAWWLHITLWQAMVMDIGLLLFFLAYTFVFNLVFDRVFGLPRSALPLKADLRQAKPA
jgi:uncharacterized membrane protein